MPIWTLLFRSKVRASTLVPDAVAGAGTSSVAVSRSMSSPAVTVKTKEADAQPLGCHLLAVQGQGHGAIKGTVVGVAIESESERSARLQDDYNFE